MLKKLMLLAMAVGALVAFSASAAQADEWYTDVEGEPVTVEGVDEVEFTGFLQSEALNGVLISGPCEVHAAVDVWNEEVEPEVVTGTGEVTKFDITTPCDVTLGGTTLPTAACQIDEANSDTSVPWHVNILPETKVDIENANFLNHYSAGCASFGIPAEGGAKGTVTGQAVNGTNEVCLVFNKSGDLEGATGEVTISGEVCAPNLTLG